jgi:hypothetical protein
LAIQRLKTHLPKQSPPKNIFKRCISHVLRKLGYVLVRSDFSLEMESLYAEDGLVSRHNSDFQRDPDFIRAYERGLKAAQSIDPNHHWRVHTALWAAGLGLNTEGDFVECGVNAGFMSSAIMEAYAWNRTGRQFFLVDSFAGPPMSQFTEDEVENGLQAQAQNAIDRGAYVHDLQRIRSNFAEWNQAKLVVGIVPDILHEIHSNVIAFLHLDMNAANPERAALEYFWPRLSNGAVVLLDDYAYMGYEAQKKAIDSLGEKLGFRTLSLPTGQGLIIKGSVVPRSLDIPPGTEVVDVVIQHLDRQS